MEFSALLDLVRKGLPVKTHSGKVESGDLFVAIPPIPGVSVDGARYVPTALSRGAAHVLVATGTDLAAIGVTAKSELERIIEHENPRRALGELAQARFGTEELSFPLVGVTGTNGKTTVTYLAEHLFAAKGLQTGVIGTVSYRWPGMDIPAPLTTPDCWTLHEMLAAMQTAGVEAAFMEVSSHALHQERAASLNYDVAVLTNVTQDHLDYHAHMEDYFQAKARLFRDRESGARPPMPNGRTGRVGRMGVINWDDPYGRRLLAEHEPALGYGLTCPEDPAWAERGLTGELMAATRDGLHLKMTYRGESWEIASPMIGHFNGANLLAAQAVGLALGLTPEDFASLNSFPGVPGRLERVINKRSVHAFVDYAHTPDALDNVLRAIKALDFNKIITVFGCGGDRDRTKRPLMAEAVARHTDLAVLTSDNPRTEDPMRIIEDTLPGLASCPKVITTPDRRAAIALALDEMDHGDVLLVAGKGHETYQQIGNEKLPFSDQAVLRELLGEAETPSKSSGDAS